MKLILATDPIFWPLTGIGRYTFELAKKIKSDARITDIRFFNMGHWQEGSEFEQFDNESKLESSDPGIGRKSFELLRGTLSNNTFATKVYSTITPYLFSQRLKQFSADYIYHSPNFMLPPYAGKKIATFHDLSIIKYPEFHPAARVSYLRPEIIRAAQAADHIITDSEAVRQEVIEFFSKSTDSVTSVPLASSLGNNCPDSDFLHTFLSRHGLQDQQFYLFVSSIEPRKNIDRILDAYELLPIALRNQYPLVLTGSSGWKSEDVLERINLLEDSGSVRYLGYTSEFELECLYCAAGALVFPSVYEGFGLPIIEAQSKGVPVITSNVSCMPEVSGGAALLVDPFDIDSISQALQRIMLDEDTRQELILKGYENTVKYSWDRTVTETLDIYSRL